jgi:MtN3 and saliva related transmembrane protein
MRVAAIVAMQEMLGWASSAILLSTIVAQIRKQWRERSGKGVSRWLYVGQTAASLGFTVYSALLHNWVFTLTNGLLLISALVGWWLTSHLGREPRSPNAAIGTARLGHGEAP